MPVSIHALPARLEDLMQTSMHARSRRGNGGGTQPDRESRIGQPYATRVDDEEIRHGAHRQIVDRTSVEVEQRRQAVVQPHGCSDEEFPVARNQLEVGEHRRDGVDHRQRRWQRPKTVALLLVEHSRHRTHARDVGGDLRHDPHHDMWRAAEIVGEQIIEENLDRSRRHGRRNARTKNVYSEPPSPNERALVRLRLSRH